MAPDGDGTTVAVVTDLTVTGRVAQFGRGVLADVSSKLLGQFVDCLEGKLAEGPTEGGAASGAAAATPAGGGGATVGGPTDIASEGAAATASWRRQRPRPSPSADGGEPSSDARLNGTSGPAVKVVDSPDAEPVDLLEAAGAPVAKRLAPAVVGLTVLWLLSIFLRRRRRSRRNR